MIKEEYKFKNDGGNIYNDVVYDKSFELLNHNYTFSLYPKTTYWRFGIRLGETAHILFFHPDGRYKEDDIPDIHTGVGEWDGIHWSLPGRIHLAQYHLPAYDHLLDRKDSYTTMGDVLFNIQYESNTSHLLLFYKAEGCPDFSTRVAIDRKFKFFKIFAWADKIDFEIDCTIRIRDMNQPIQGLYNGTKNYWLLKLNSQKWAIDEFIEGQPVFFHTHTRLEEERIDYDRFLSVQLEDEVIGYAFNDHDAVVCTFIVTEAAGFNLGQDEKIRLKITHLVAPPIPLRAFSDKISGQQELGNESPIRLISLTREEFNGILSSAVTDPGSEKSLLEQEMLPDLVSDADRGTDYLDIASDIRAFAKAIAVKSFEPPLAIALFGKWGSGKSFFMRHLREQIIRLSSDKSYTVYCEGIVHIHFNAWSYLDANLWASLVSRIFEGLNEYISENSASEKLKKKIETELTSQLTFSREEMAILTNKKDSLHDQIKILDNKKQTLANKLNGNITKIKENTAWKILQKTADDFGAKEKIKAALLNNPGFVHAEAEVKEILPEEYWADPEKAYDQLQSKYTFLKEFFRPDVLWRNLGWLFLFLLLLVLVPYLLKIVLSGLQQSTFLIPQAVLSVVAILATIRRRAQTVYQKLQPMITSLWGIKEAYEKGTKAALAKFEQQEKALYIQIEKNKLEIHAINQQIQQAKLLRSDLEFKINNALATESLYAFIDRRSKSEEYKRHLGIVSIIRRDFEILSNLFTDHHTEWGKTIKAGEFRKNFKKPLERIILYIDDLDRCPEENVVHVLDAVNLLMAFPLFVVIVGVDPRWVKNALRKKHSRQFLSTPSGSNEDDLIEPSNYLEKIFQVPFHLKDAEDSNVKNMLKNLAQPGKNSLSEQPRTDPDAIASKEQPKEPERIALADDAEQEIPPPSLYTEETRIASLIITEREISQMQSLSSLIGPNPRAIKRFVNIYRIVKIHENLSVGQENEETELLTIMFLIALSVGVLKDQYKHLLSVLLSQKTAGLLPAITLSSFLDEPAKETGVREIKDLLNQYIDNSSGGKKIKDIPLVSIDKYVPFIHRFTFKSI